MASSSSSLLAQYPYPSTLNVGNFVSVKLSKTNYLLWKTQMLGLIESQDLLGFIDGTNPAPAETTTIPDDSSTNGTRETENQDYKAWRRSDRLLKGWIIGSLSEDVLGVVVGLDTTASARDVWTVLKKTCVPDSQEQVQPESTEQVQPESNAAAAQKDLSWYLPLYKAALRGDWESAKRFFKQDENAITARITREKETALHVAAGTAKAIHFVEKLMELMPKEALLLTNNGGSTALTIAAMVGNTQVAKMLVEKNPDLLYIKNDRAQFPVYRAALFAQRDTAIYLLAVTKDDVESSPFADQSGVDLLTTVINVGFLDVALDLVQRYPRLATLMVPPNYSVLEMIAGKASAFPSGSLPKLLARLNIFLFCLVGIPVKLENYPNINGRDIENPTDSSQVIVQMRSCFQLFGRNYFISVCQKLRTMLWKVIEFLVPSVKHIRDKKLMHHQALQLVKCLCEKIKLLNNSEAWSSLYIKPVQKAARLGIHEVVKEIVETFPDAVWSKDENEHYIFHQAVLYRCENVFNLIYQMSEYKQNILQFTDTSRNNSLHLAGRLAPPHKLQLVSGAALQMQRELQWFKEVEKFVNPDDKELENYTNETPAMIFSKEHKDLIIEGEKWMKDTANSCTIAAALIATVVFAAAFTVPGGNKENDGLPFFSEDGAFIIFAVSDAISLFTSTTSLLMFLSILTSRYAERDFLYALPKRLIFGLVTLFLSITSMLIAFSATLYLVFGQKKAWIIIPVAALACLPVTSFVSLQFPLLVDVISSTYGPGIFGKQSDHPID